jgi:hypothetical protein
MRTSIVPAQITTVEDKIAGNFSMQQALLLGSPLILGFFLALLMPPTGQFVLYKVIIVTIFFIIMGPLAIRIKDRIIAQWLHLIILYMIRPSYYVYDKNSTYLRDYEVPNETISDNKVYMIKSTMPYKHPDIAPQEKLRLEKLTKDTRVNLHFKINRRGSLDVKFTEIE